MIELEKIKTNELVKDFLSVKPFIIKYKKMDAKLKSLKYAFEEINFDLYRENDIHSNLKIFEEKIKGNEKVIISLEDEIERAIPKAKKISNRIFNLIRK